MPLSHNVASLTADDTTGASFAIGDSCVASRITGNSALVSVGSGRMAPARIDSAGVVSAWHQSRLRTRKLGKEVGAERLRKDRKMERLLLLGVEPAAAN